MSTIREIPTHFLRHPDHGALPFLLLVLTLVTGLVDAASILGLGRVFVANMTGNVVFTGFGLAGVPGYSVLGSVLALAGFLAGAAGGGVVVARIPQRRFALALSSTTELVLDVATVALLAATDRPNSIQLAAVTLLSIGLGTRNAVVRSLGVPDLTTTVLTMSLTGIGADLMHGKPFAALRRLLSVGMMLAGAAAGAALYVTAGVVPVLISVAVLLAGVTVGAIILSDGPSSA